jgi:hypothetical protein
MKNCFYNKKINRLIISVINRLRQSKATGLQAIRDYNRMYTVAVVMKVGNVFYFGTKCVSENFLVIFARE